MKVGVIIPVFNDKRVKRALDSALAQKHHHDSCIIVVDGASTDGTLEVLAPYRDRIALISEPDDGIYHGINKGLVYALKNSCEIIHYLSANDFYHSSSVIQDVLDVFNNKNAAAVYGDVLFTNKKEQLIRRWIAGPHKRFKWLLGWMPPHVSFFVRRSAYEKYGLFDLNYQIASDYELMLRFLYKNKINAEYINKPLIIMSTGGISNTLRGIIKANIEVARACAQHKLVTWPLIPFFKIARRPIQFILPRLGYKREQCKMII